MLKNYFIYVISLVLVAVAVPLALQQSQQPQEIRQRAQGIGLDNSAFEVSTNNENTTLDISPSTPQGVTPTIYCVGGVGAPPCAPITSPTAPTGGSVTPGNSTPPVGGTNPTTNPNPTIEPCTSDSSASIQSNKGKKKKKSNGGFLEEFFKFLMKIIEWFLGGGGTFPPGNPQPTGGPEPTDDPEPTGGPEPTTNPCPEPTETVTPSEPAASPSQPMSSTQPTVIPSTGGPSGTPGQQDARLRRHPSSSRWTERSPGSSRLRSHYLIWRDSRQPEDL